MKKLLMLAVVAAAVVLLATCSMLKVSIDECVGNFMSDVNAGNYGNLYTHLDSGSSQYNVAKAGNYWSSAIFPSGENYTLSGQSISGNTVTATLTSSGVIYPGNTITFGMSTDSGGNAVIKTINIPGGPIASAYY